MPFTKPQLYRFDDDGQTPNNPRLPLLLYRGVVENGGHDPAAAYETMFEGHGWGDSWRNGIFPFLHFHAAAHEVLGIARGSAEVQFGGDSGQTLKVEAGDVVVLPAGTGHRRLSASPDLLVVGAYPAGSDYGQHRPGQIDLHQAQAPIARVPLPDQDPVYGEKGPLIEAWRASS